MNNLYNDLSPAIQKLSEIFCVSVEYLQEHLMEYVLMYGKYHFATELSVSIPLVLLVGLVFGLATYGLFADETHNIKRLVKIAFAVGITVVLIVGIFIALPYLVAPEMYSVHAVMELINGG